MTTLLVLALGAAILAAAYARLLLRRFTAERHEHRRVLDLFSRYVPAPVVNELLARRDPRLFQAREYYATVVFVRIRNFALFSEPLSPDETLRYLNEFYAIVGKAVQHQRGMIEALRGDSVVAVFGVLLDETLQEDRALRAALEIMRIVKGMERRWSAQNRKPFEVGIGVNSGKIVAGDIGFAQRREFAVIGNPVDVAAKLELTSEELKATIVASHTTYDVVRDAFVGVPASSVPLRGLRRLHNAYVIRGLRRAGSDDPLTVPPERAFAQTVVESEHVAPPLEPDAPNGTIAPDRVEVPAAALDVRVAASVGEARPFLAMPPERGEGRRFSSLDADEPALPEPGFDSTYEDDRGPPIQLPP